MRTAVTNRFSSGEGDSMAIGLAMGSALRAMAASLITLGLISGVQAQESGFTAGGPGGLNERGGAVSRIQAEVSPVQVVSGGKAVIKITVDVARGFHINANQPGDENMIPTTLTFDKPKTGIAFGKTIYPVPISVKVSYSDKPLKVHEGSTVITTPITIDPRKVQPGKITLKGKLRYQGCNATTCLPPATADINVTFIVNGKK